MANQFSRSLLRMFFLPCYLIRNTMVATDGMASSQAGGQQIAALANLGTSSFHATTWQISLTSFAILAFVLVANTILFRNLPLIEGCIMTLHCLAFLAIVVVLAYVLKHHPTARDYHTNVSRPLQGDGTTSKSIKRL